MLVNDEVDFGVTGFLDLFKKKFSNFCTKAPVLLTYDIVGDKVLVKEHNPVKSRILTYTFDYNISVKQNIKAIKDWLVENTYPRMIQQKKIQTEYSASELESIMEQTGKSIDEVALMRKETVETYTWRIEKILVKKDELFVRNLTTNKQYRYKMKCPSTYFLKNLRDKWTAEMGYFFFEKNSVYLNEIYEILDTDIEMDDFKF
jgi:hypothetical protein